MRGVALITLVLVVVAGAAQATFNANEFESIWDGMWWAVVTVTFVADDGGLGEVEERVAESSVAPGYEGR